MPTIYIDDQAYEVPEGDNVLQACLSAGVDLPYFCWHPEMGSIGACRQCALVQFRDADDEHGRIVMGCMTPVSDGARFSMDGTKASEFRKNVVESLMLNHPHDCPVCAEGGECHLQDMTVMVGHRNRRYRGKKNTHNNQDLGPLINHEMNRCISCYRCTRFYNDYAGGTDLSAQGAHDHVYFGRQEDGTLESEFAGNLVEVCPTGVFTDKPLVNDYTRKWDMQSAPSVCTACALGCNTLPGERYGKLKRIHNRFNNDVNGYFLCDRGRYAGEYVNDEQRAKFAGSRSNDGRYNAIESSEAINVICGWLGSNNGSNIAAIGSPRASIESNYLLRKLVGAENYNCGIGDHEAYLIREIAAIMQSDSVNTPSIRQVESADAVLILGEDLTNTAPRLALALRQSVRNAAKSMASDMRIADWQDEAIRVLAQDTLSPMYIIATSNTRLDDVAKRTVTMSPSDIARFAFGIAAELDSSLKPLDHTSESQSELIKVIAADLKSAEKPLIITGTGCQSQDIIRAAAMINRALDTSQSMLSFCLSEANSMGAWLLKDGSEPSLDELCQRANRGEIETLLVVENDLFRRAQHSQIQALIDNIANIVVLDCVATPTLSQSSIALPSASFAESQGTLVSSEARAQRYYPAFEPAEQRQATWKWLKKIGQSMEIAEFDSILKFDDVTAACATTHPMLAGIVEASPDSGFRDRGMKIPRQTHRNSGRTAMLADISVHEPKQAVDEDSPFTYSMEGVNGKQPGALIPFVWAPGWNSNQSVHKFQSEAGGALAGGTPGKRLFDKSLNNVKINEYFESDNNYIAPFNFEPKAGLWQLFPLYRIFGSDELSAYSAAIKELTPSRFVELSENDSISLGVVDGDAVLLSLAGTSQSFEVKVNNSIPTGCAGYTAGLPDSVWIAPATSVKIEKDPARVNQKMDVPETQTIVTESGRSNV
jgi:NADH-quinone oxidoreductase subunit G